MKSDAQIQEAVCEELKWDPSVIATDIGVEVSTGIVTLFGHVGSHSEKVAAERAAQRVIGVKGVAIAIAVKLPLSSHREDADIARTASNVLSWSTYVPYDNLQVLVEHGWITLTGEVRWDFERRGAVSAVRDLMGVVGVISHIRIREAVSVASLKHEIEATLKRRAHDEAKAISVDVSGSEVVLTGSVHNLAERDLVTNAVWGTPGVCNVIDRLSVT